VEVLRSRGDPAELESWSSAQGGKIRFRFQKHDGVAIACGNTVTGYPLPLSSPNSIENDVDAISTFVKPAEKRPGSFLGDSCSTEGKATSKGSSKLSNWWILKCRRLTGQSYVVC